jgi:hypothetical protein
MKQAFFEVCKEAVPAEGSYVSLYADSPYYGGPEEGGWWGSDTALVAYYKCVSQVEAEAVLAKVEKLAQELSAEAKTSFNRGCRAEVEWLEARGLDADFLPEVDGETRYWVHVEKTPGECVSQGDRHYC